MYTRGKALCALAVLALASVAAADVIVDYTFDAGGSTSDPLNGLSARGTFSRTGDQLAVVLENTSTGVPDSFMAADSLLVSVGMNLPDGVAFLSGDAAEIGVGSVGIGSWTGRVAGDSVAEQWLWTNGFGGDLLEGYAQIISTSDGQGGAAVTRFDGLVGGMVGGPFGGIAAEPPVLTIPDQQPAASDSIRFELTLTAPITDLQLADLADGSIVEFGSDARYLTVPEPATGLLTICGLALLRRRWSGFPKKTWRPVSVPVTVGLQRPPSGADASRRARSLSAPDLRQGDRLRFGQSQCSREPCRMLTRAKVGVWEEADHVQGARHICAVLPRHPRDSRGRV
jgi:hypothetical protein